ncbi:DUF3343 domain-containing protein [Clostridium polynesiense]|uniref:DUF3343 domain-containing protein n=1 Tax=Clostridium polynesiense TaxID=1325933 RepID=UPI00058F83A3|nr:DUF3343 domain-containing protein [Clostridium polynesiense]
MDNYFIIVFNNTHNAIEGEKTLKNEGITVTIMPTPAQITQSCGISIKFNEEDLDRIKELVQQEKLHIKNIYHKIRGEFNTII